MEIFHKRALLVKTRVNWRALDVGQRLASPHVVFFAISDSVHSVDLAGITVAMPLPMLQRIEDSLYVALNLLAPLMSTILVLLALIARRSKSGFLGFIGYDLILVHR